MTLMWRYGRYSQSLLKINKASLTALQGSDVVSDLTERGDPEVYCCLMTKLSNLSKLIKTRPS